jgi:transcriptional regulator with XRE-family HTH domain
VEKIMGNSFATRLQLAMTQSQISASELARRASVTPTAVWNWQQGNTEPRPQALTAIAKALNVSEDFLRDGSKQVNILSANELQALPANQDTLAEMLEELRGRIARVTGFALDRVKLNLEFKSD